MPERALLALLAEALGPEDARLRSDLITIDTALVRAAVVAIILAAAGSSTARRVDCLKFAVRIASPVAALVPAMNVIGRLLMSLRLAVVWSLVGSE